MFSTNQQAYIEALLPTYAKEGYKYYVAYTDSVGNSGYYTSTNPDLYVIVSKERISAQDAYSYDIKDNSLIISVRCGNYSSNSSANNSERVTVAAYSPKILNIPVYEHIYTNAEFEAYALQPDYYLCSVGETNVQVQANSFLILSIALFLALSRLWFRTS